jgi:hypothetical protein
MVAASAFALAYLLLGNIPRPDFFLSHHTLWRRVHCSAFRNKAQGLVLPFRRNSFIARDICLKRILRK